ncbi:hypothetical protein QR685DRAFT_542830 [Neurospora intermedia]|uniref:Uncharacterized protein n=1 Tax=Neurospora intermedia TaxID=5142 RepID=A0ABR3DFS2_NEUIN
MCGSDRKTLNFVKELSGKQYPGPQQLPAATPDLDGIPPRPWTEVTSVPALYIGGSQTQPQLEYKSDLGHLDELHLPFEKPYQSLHSPFPQAAYRPYQPSQALTNAPERQVKSLRGGCQLFDIQHGMHATSAPPPAPTCISLGLGVGLDFPPSWYTQPPPIHRSLPSDFDLLGPPNFSPYSSQEVPLPLEEPEWTFFPSPSPLIPYTQPFS